MVGIFGKILGGLGLDKNFLFGTPAKNKQLDTLTKSQRRLQNQLEMSAMQPGAGGVYGDIADYYRSNLSNNPQDLEAFTSPELRQYKEQIIPELSEQFAGMGSGNLSSSSFRNAAVNAGTDLSERLAALRAQLRQNSVAGLSGIGQQALRPTKENAYESGQPGFIDQAIPVATAAAASYFGGPGAAPIGYQVGNQFRNSFNAPKVGRNTSPYGQQANQAQNVMNATWGAR